MTPAVVFNDEYLLVLDKPPGLVVTSSETKKEPSLEDILASQGSTLERAGIVHRLDKDTSGLLVVAKKQDVLENLQSQFKERGVLKEYLALVHGWVEKGGRIEASIARNPGDREKFVVVDGSRIEGREAVTEYQPVQKFLILNSKLLTLFEGFNKIQMKKLEKSGFGKFTLLKCHPLTGRTHQIRVHLKYLGHPLVGDQKYGGRKTTRLDHRFCPRQFLHAARLEFTHPVTGERIKLESNLPEDLEKALGYLEKSG
ncbi:MAG: RluA family pseudouridine synthase [bacterium]|nr:RluA family pseudouridine synthase [bacterium]